MVKNPKKSAPSRAQLTPFDLALYSAVGLIWGLSWLPLRLQLGVVAPEVSGVWRFGIAAAIMFVWLSIARIPLSLARADHLRCLVLGATMFSTNFVFAYYSGFYLASGLIATIFSLTAVFNPLLSAATGRVLLDARVLIGAVLGVAGIALLFGPDLAKADAGGGTMIGLALAVGATLSFCLGNLFSASFQGRGLPVLPANAWGMLYGTLLMALAAFLRGEAFTVEWTARYVLSVLWLALPATVIGMFAYVTLIGRIGSSRTAYTTVLMPAVALLVSTLFEDYRWSVAALLGIVFVLAGNAIVLSTPRAK